MLQLLLKVIKEDRIGQIKKITSSFGFDMGKIIPESRLFRKDLAGGAILIIKSYGEVDQLTLKEFSE